jgi:hypothetical protein
MKRLLITFVIAIIAGVSVASGASLLRAKPAPVAADTSRHTLADSTPVRVIDATVGGSATQKSGVADSAAQRHDSAAKSVSASPHNAVAPSATATSPDAAHTPNSSAPKFLPIAQPVAAPAAEVPAAERRISRVIAAMPPRDAAKVLTQLADHDVAIILGNLTEKQEAAILSQLPSDRLAAVSKLALRPIPRAK